MESVKHFAANMDSAELRPYIKMEAQIVQGAPMRRLPQIQILVLFPIDVVLIGLTQIVDVEVHAFFQIALALLVKNALLG